MSSIFFHNSEHFEIQSISLEILRTKSDTPTPLSKLASYHANIRTIYSKNTPQSTNQTIPNDTNFQKDDVQQANDPQAVQITGLLIS